MAIVCADRLVRDADAAGSPHCRPGGAPARAFTSVGARGREGRCPGGTRVPRGAWWPAWRRRRSAAGGLAGGGGEPGAGRIAAKRRAIAVRYGRHERWGRGGKSVVIGDEFTDVIGWPEGHPGASAR